MYKFSTLSSKPEHACSKLELDVSGKHLYNEYKHATRESCVILLVTQERPALERPGARKAFVLAFLTEETTSSLEKGPCVQTRNWQWTCHLRSQADRLFHGGERAELCLFSPTSSVWTGKCKGAWNLFSSMSTSWLQFLVPGTLKNTPEEHSCSVTAQRGTGAANSTVTEASPQNS